MKKVTDREIVAKCVEEAFQGGCATARTLEGLVKHVAVMALALKAQPEPAKRPWPKLDDLHKSNWADVTLSQDGFNVVTSFDGDEIAALKVSHKMMPVLVAWMRKHSVDFPATSMRGQLHKDRDAILAEIDASNFHLTE